MYHIPVMLQECIDGLAIRPDGLYVDVTFGGGGHSHAIARRLGPEGHLYAFDQDADAEHHWQSAAQDAGMTGQTDATAPFTFICSNFRYLKNWMRYYGVDHIDGLLADLGVSSHHLDTAERGFSFRHDAPLDMRMNTRSGMSAAELVATATEEQLTHILQDYGELRQARRMARAIAAARQQGPVVTTGHLLHAVQPCLNPKQEKKELAQVFQALRIEVNHELQALEEMLQAAIGLLAPGGRLVVMTYHSLEDRIVKNVIRSGHADGRIEKDFYGRIVAPLRAVNNKVVVASDDEVARNPRARSAKLRIAERITQS